MNFSRHPHQLPADSRYRCTILTGSCPEGFMPLGLKQCARSPSFVSAAWPGAGPTVGPEGPTVFSGHLQDSALCNSISSRKRWMARKARSSAQCHFPGITLWSWSGRNRSEQELAVCENRRAQGLPRLCLGQSLERDAVADNLQRAPWSFRLL